MRPIASCSLQFNPSFGEYALLDDSGDLIEAGKIRMTRAALWNRFAALTPSVIGVNYDPHFLWAVEMLTQLGHAIVFAGSVPQLLREELKPALGILTGTALLCPTGRDKSGIFFLVDQDGEQIIDAHYMVGPVTSETKLGSLVKTIPQSVEAGSAQDCACRLYQLMAAGMIKLPEVAFAHALKGNAVAAA